LIGEGEAQLSNTTVGKVRTGRQARFGKKGRTKWYGYKIHAVVDMSHGLIARVAVTPANVEDQEGARHVLPRSGMVFGDKAYGVGKAAWAKRRGRFACGACTPARC
jgi:IS5 family transposase